jgi:endoglucanase
MRINSHIALAMLIGLTASLGACKKKVIVTGAEVKSSPEGRACPRSEGLIADGENNSNQIADIKNRGGYWYTFSDDLGTSVVPETGKNGGTFQMSPGGANGTKFAAHMSGTVGGSGNVHAGMGLNFVDPKGQYNASKYKGVSFWAKKGPGTGAVRLKVPDVATEPDGKVCKECFNDFGMDLTLTDQWTQYTIPFTSMKQLKGWGSPHTDGVDPATLYGLQWQVNEPGAQFDIWIDEIEFTGCGG